MTIETEDVVEAVARVMCAANFARQGCEGEFGSVDDCWFAWADEARAVLAATPIERLREENARRVEDAYREGWNAGGNAHREVSYRGYSSRDDPTVDQDWSRSNARAALNQQ